ncbi:exo-alpha-sialidase [Ulvibacterium sp.]|uniref:VPS10 domain-containing protein n=1 Tax=Ulvibacterium sp. TaxID=2665914 RepID=UPI00261BBB9C|nr:exo-alpha-sialidase [Ulvibacterium sp.]
MRGFVVISLLFLHSSIFGQLAPTPPQKVMEALHQKNQMAQNSLVKNIPLKNVGPSVMSGRVVDLDVNPVNPAEFYVGYASGGLWYTKNNGTSFVPVLDSSETQNVGDIAVDWNLGTIWVGSGENNASRSSYAGIGILKSEDKGQTWQHMGLADSHHIGRILLNPNNPDEVVVGVTGHLYSPNSERGVFKTTDGGKSWQKTLFLDNETGIIDVSRVPDNFNILYAATWKKDRKAWNFIGNGDSSGIYKSEDGGTTWSKISTPESGFPTGEGVGRIGLAVYDENVVYAVHDSQFRREKPKKARKKSRKLDKDDFKTMSVEHFLNLDNQKLNDFLKTNNFQEKYRAENVKQLVRSGSVKPMDLAKYLEDANALLFDTPVIGAEVYRSNDGGKTWTKQNENYIDDLFYSYGYYFAQIRVDPNDWEKIYLGGVPILKSEDGGKTYTSISDKNVHADHHALWINPNRNGHLINGNDGGVNITYDDGENWIKNNSPSVGQFYAINVDNEEPYNIYGGLQDNGVWKGPHNTQESNLWHQTGQYPWKSILGGDGMQVQIDNRTSNTVYTGYQFGNYYRLDLEKNQQIGIMPKHELGTPPYRFNWQTPILLSSHNQDILYMGSNILHRSMNQGDDWEPISADLTQGGRKGNVAYGTLTTISESPFAFGLLYTGSDDGVVHVSKNGGGSWEIISNTFPKDLWISRVSASKHKKERVYVALNGYRWDDFTSYVFVSDDYGKSWKDISKGIPASPINVILEDSENENLLFLGTDNGLYVSFDRGESWEVFQNGMPNVAVHDLVVQPKAKHLLVGTHGRSIYKADIAHLQQLKPNILEKDLHIFEISPIAYSSNWGNSPGVWSKPTTPGLDIVFYSSNSANFSAAIKTLDGIAISGSDIQANKGLNILSYDMAFSKSGKMAYLKKNKKELKEARDGKTYLPQGKYLIELEGNGQKAKVEFEVKDASEIK